jgi:hypothetical protein
MKSAIMKAAKKTEDRLDLYRTYSKEYVATKTPVLVEVGSATYLSIKGKGAPGGAAFTGAVGALYGVAFTVKMTRKFAGKPDYVVSKLEGLWPTLKFGEPAPDKEQWTWQMMIRTPDFITEKEVKSAIAVLLKRGKTEEVQRVQIESLEEGLCVQSLHVGPYEKECCTLEIMKSVAEKKGMKFHGVHHEIYLSDPRRVDPAKLKTILRHPVKAA